MTDVKQKLIWLFLAAGAVAALRTLAGLRGSRSAMLLAAVLIVAAIALLRVLGWI